MQTVKVFMLGRSQAVRIPARYRFDASEVEVFQRGDELVLRPKAETAGEMFARVRAKYGPLDIKTPSRKGGMRPVPPLKV